MTFIIETGTGISGASSYVALDVADAHFTALGNTGWTDAPQGQRTNALSRASLYVDFYDYGGTVLTSHQGLKWPRSGARDREGRELIGLPHALRTAVLELADAYIADANDGLETRQVIREKVGPVELVYSKTKRQPSFVFRLLMQIGARPTANEMRRG